MDWGLKLQLTKDSKQQSYHTKVSVSGWYD